MLGVAWWFCVYSIVNEKPVKPLMWITCSPSLSHVTYIPVSGALGVWPHSHFVRQPTTHQHHQVRNECGPWSWAVLVGAMQCFAISYPAFWLFAVVATVMGASLGHTHIGEERGELGSRRCCGLLLFCSTAFVTSSQTVFKFSFTCASVTGKH